MSNRLIAMVLLCAVAWVSAWAVEAASSMAIVDSQIAAHPQQTGVYVLDTGEAALLAKQVQTLIENDMRLENSWNAADEPDQHGPLTKRGYVRLWQLLPLNPLL